MSVSSTSYSSSWASDPPDVRVRDDGMVTEKFDVVVRSHRLHAERFGSPAALLVIGLHGRAYTATQHPYERWKHLTLNTRPEAATALANFFAGVRG